MIDLEKARSCVFQANYHLTWATKYRRKVLLGSVEVRLEEVLKTIANQSGFALLAARDIVKQDDSIIAAFKVQKRLDLADMRTGFNFLQRFVKDVVKREGY